MTIRQRLAYTLLIIAMGAAFVLAAPPHPADAATITFEFEGSDFLIPRPQANAPVGDLRLVATYDVIANGHEAYIGSVCTFVVTAANGVSVHGNNQGFLVTNGSSTDVLRTEDEANVLRTVLDDPTLRLGETVQLYNIIGEWADGDNIREGFVGTSVDYEVTATCTVQDGTTTTTTSPSSTTSLPSTTTTVPVGTTTTTTPDGSTTTIPATTTTAPTGSTSTTAPGSSTSTTAPPASTTSSIPPITTVSTLPFTGPEDVAGLAFAGAALLMLGGGIVLATKEAEL